MTESGSPVMQLIPSVQLQGDFATANPSRGRPDVGTGEKKKRKKKRRKKKGGGGGGDQKKGKNFF